ncbi:MAG: DUF2007 domain-containing protein [Solirubrobacterales bacterium]|nr:DUF2007 domain-containing protein [Solirubrobacterales bacterium]
MSDERLLCPACSNTYPPSERFCEDCGMPLVHADAPATQASERRKTARKINPQYAEGRLVKVARAESGPEAEFIAGLLLEEGIPSMVRRAGGFDVAEFLAAGPREVLVPESGAQAAREALDFQSD